MRVVNLISPLPNGNTVNEIMDERSDITSKAREMTKDCGYKGGNDNPESEVEA